MKLTNLTDIILVIELKGFLKMKYLNIMKVRSISLFIESMRDFTPKESKSSLWENRGINDFLRERKSKLK